MRELWFPRWVASLALALALTPAFAAKGIIGGWNALGSCQESCNSKVLANGTRPTANACHGYCVCSLTVDTERLGQWKGAEKVVADGTYQALYCKASQWPSVYPMPPPLPGMTKPGPLDETYVEPVPNARDHARLEISNACWSDGLKRHNLKGAALKEFVRLCEKGGGTVSAAELERLKAGGEAQAPAPKDTSGADNPENKDRPKQRPVPKVDARQRQCATLGQRIERAKADGAPRSIVTRLEQRYANTCAQG